MATACLTVILLPDIAESEGCALLKNEKQGGNKVFMHIRRLSLLGAACAEEPWKYRHPFDRSGRFIAPPIL